MPISESEHFGIFRAAVFTADRALPVEGAEILIFEQGATSPIFRLTTDGSGLTEPIPLKAPPAADSLRPGQALPFSDYRILVSALGYDPLSVLHLPVFDGVENTLPAALVPNSAYRSQSLVPIPETQAVPEDPQALGKEQR